MFATTICVLLLSVCAKAQEERLRVPRRQLDVITSQCKEGVAWLRNSFPDLVVCAKLPCLNRGAQYDSLCSLNTTKGVETSSYLSYIVSRYDNLPETVAFLHGHEHARHQNGKDTIVSLIRRARVDLTGYVSLNALFIAPDVKDDRIKWWHDLVEPTLGPYPCTLGSFGPCCAQFMVSRHRILEIPKATWSALLVYSISGDGEVRERTLEFMWHILFGQECIAPITDTEQYLNKFFS